MVFIFRAVLKGIDEMLAFFDSCIKYFKMKVFHLQHISCSIITVAFTFSRWKN